jgi:hypothetical protein
MKPLRWSPYVRHDGTLCCEVAASNGYQVQTVVYVFGTGHQAALAMFEVSEKLRLVANDALRDAPRPGGK